MKQFFELDMEVPSSDRNLVIDLPSWLKIAGKRSKVMIVLDALNQLDSGAAGSGINMYLKHLNKIDLFKQTNGTLKHILLMVCYVRFIGDEVKSWSTLCSYLISV